MRGKVDRVVESVDCLLVEGENDRHVFCSLLKHHNIPERFKVKSKEGITKLLDELDVELDRSGLSRLGIVVDADASLKDRWIALRSRLVEYGYKTVPTIPKPEGVILLEDGRPVVGIWLMPNNRLPGMLEDFVSFLVPPEDILWPVAEEIVQRVKSIETNLRFRDAYESKARIHTWLAWQKEPGKPMGQAITARYLDADAPHARDLMTWIRKLFGLDGPQL